MTKEKEVDESWKESAFQEKNTQGDESSESSLHISDALKEELEQEKQATEHQHHEGCGCGHDHESEDVMLNFINYISSLGFQSLVFMGEIPNPATNEMMKNLDQAKLLIDTLIMLKEKTQGNLSPDEENLLNATCYELQLKFVEVQKKDQGQDD